MTIFCTFFSWVFATANLADEIFLSQLNFLTYIHKGANRDHIQVKTSMFALKVWKIVYLLANFVSHIF